jgi:hypothetical protein
MSGNESIAPINEGQINKFLALLSIFAIILIPLSFWGGAVYGSNRETSIPSTRHITPVIDGFLETEWEYADVKIAQYLNLDNSIDPQTNTANKDGWNYLYVGEDLDNIYVAIDLCGDQTNNTSGEWVGLFFNIMNRTFGGNDLDEVFWDQYRNNGVESLVYDVSNDKIYDQYIWDDEPKGEFIYSFGNYSNQRMYITGEIDGEKIHSVERSVGSITKDYIAIEVVVDLLSWFNVSQEFLPYVIADLDNLTIQFDVRAYYNETFSTDNSEIESIMNTPTREIPFNLSKTEFTHNEIKVQDEEITDGTLRFVIEVMNQTDYQENLTLSIESASFNYNRSRYKDELYATSTITNFSMAWDYNSSVNEVNAHRIFEFKIPKNQLEGLTNNFQIFVQGYGTATTYYGYNQYRLIKGYSFSAGNDVVYFFDFPLYTPDSPDWDQNYYPVQLGRKKPLGNY